MSAFEQLQALPAVDVLAMAGCEEVGRRWSPCPACGHEGERRRGAVVVCTDGRRWHCPRCQKTADALGTAQILSGATEWRDVFTWAESCGWVSPSTGERRPVRPPVRSYTGNLPVLPKPERVLVKVCDSFEDDTLVEREEWGMSAQDAAFHLSEMQRDRDALRRKFWAGSSLALLLPSPRHWVRAWQSLHTTNDVIHIRTSPDGWNLCS